jgi:excisionase family DNA binding protein
VLADRRRVPNFSEVCRVADEALWTSDQACEYFGIGRRTLDRWRAHRGLPYMRVGRVVRFMPDELREWRRARSVVANSIETGADLVRYSRSKRGTDTVNLAAVRGPHRRARV